ncbi:MAG: hypothetical protein NC911_08195 [Candidatus Omnitrophica bacterium]|nr:hypothetical protein [Candidatus Omnitrophota bacterium]
MIRVIWSLVFMIGLGLLVILSPRFFSKLPQEKSANSEIRQVEWMMNRYEYAYTLVCKDLPKFYFCHPHDLAVSRLERIRIWDPAKGDLKRGRSDAELKYLLPQKYRKHWCGPYLTRPPYNVRIDPWLRPYRVFWFSPANPGELSETESKIIPPGQQGAMIIISAGPDGLLESCASDKSTLVKIRLTAPAVEKAREKDFKNFDPFHPLTTGKDFFRVLKIKGIADPEAVPVLRKTSFFSAPMRRSSCCRVL